MDGSRFIDEWITKSRHLLLSITWPTIVQFCVFMFIHWIATRLTMIEKIVTCENILRRQVVIILFDILRKPDDILNIFNIFNVFNVYFQSSTCEVFKDRWSSQISTFHQKISSKNYATELCPLSMPKSMYQIC